MLKITLKSASKTSDFIKTLPQKIVPKDYGGLAPNMSETNGKNRKNIYTYYVYIFSYFKNNYFYFKEILKQKLLESREYFLEEEKFRNGHSNDEANIKVNEVEGNDTRSFKNLSID